jgi:hypothetical protein
VRVVKTLNGAPAKGCDGFGAQELLGDLSLRLLINCVVTCYSPVTHGLTEFNLVVD